MVVSKRIAAGELKAKCLVLIDEVAESLVPLAMPKRAIPIAPVLPVGPLATQDPPRLLGRVRYTEEDDLMAPVAVDWDAER